MNPEDEEMNTMEEEFDEEAELEELVEENDVYLHALIDLLISKGIITKEEYEKKLDEFDNAEDDEETD